MRAISEQRWQIAQKYEADYWAIEAQNPEKLARDIADGHHFTAGVLDIRADTVSGATVLDIAGGPFPLGAAPDLQLLQYVIVDPGDYPKREGVQRIKLCAEEYRDLAYQEVWGYNVLQHVKEPAAVLQTVRMHARKFIRWFDVVDTPIYPVHPPSIKADWLRQELSRDGFRIVRDIDGSRLVEGQRQKWVALVAECQ